MKVLKLKKWAKILVTIINIAMLSVYMFNRYDYIALILFIISMIIIQIDDTKGWQL